MAALAIFGCASTPQYPKNQATVFDQPIEKVKQAAVDALVANGFNINKQEPTYIQGSRPHKVGLFVGSGGETAGVWLEKLDDNRTSVKVSTAESLAGNMGQKSWDGEILTGMTKILGK